MFLFGQVYDQYDPNVKQDMLVALSDMVSSQFGSFQYGRFAAVWALSITWSNVQAISDRDVSVQQLHTHHDTYHTKETHKIES